MKTKNNISANILPMIPFLRAYTCTYVHTCHCMGAWDVYTHEYMECIHEGDREYNGARLRIIQEDKLAQWQLDNSTCAQ